MTPTNVEFVHDRKAGIVTVFIAGDDKNPPVFPAGALWRRIDGKDITYAQRAATGITDAERMENTIAILEHSGFRLGEDGVWRGKTYDAKIANEPTYDGGALIIEMTANEEARKKWAAERKAVA